MNSTTPLALVTFKIEDKAETFIFLAHLNTKCWRVFMLRVSHHDQFWVL